MQVHRHSLWKRWPDSSPTNTSTSAETKLLARSGKSTEDPGFQRETWHEEQAGSAGLLQPAPTKDRRQAPQGHGGWDEVLHPDSEERRCAIPAWAGIAGHGFPAGLSRPARLGYHPIRYAASLAALMRSKPPSGQWRASAERGRKGADPGGASRMWLGAQTPENIDSTNLAAQCGDCRAAIASPGHCAVIQPRRTRVGWDWRAAARRRLA